MTGVTYIEPRYSESGINSFYIETPGSFDSKQISINDIPKMCFVGSSLKHHIVIKKPKEYFFHKIVLLLVKKTKTSSIVSRGFFRNKYNVYVKKRIILESIIRVDQNFYDEKLHIKSNPILPWYLEESTKSKCRKIKYFLQVYVQLGDKQGNIHMIKKDQIVNIQLSL